MSLVPVVEPKGTGIAAVALAFLAVAVVLASIQVRFIERHGGSWWYVALIPVAVAVIFLAIAGIDAFEIDRLGRVEAWKRSAYRQARAWLSRGLLVLLIAGIVSVAMEGVAAEGTDLGAGTSMSALSRIRHIVVIYEENHSFDNLYGGWGKRVNGLANARAAGAEHPQIGQRGRPYRCLLQNDVNLASPRLAADCTDATTKQTFTSAFTNEPFEIDEYIPPEATTCPRASVAYKPKYELGVRKGSGLPGGCTRDLVHSFYQAQYQLDHGRMDRFVTGSNAVGLVMGYYNTQKLPIWAWLHQDGHPRYAILDNFFQAAFGGSFLNHQWLIAASTPVYRNPPRKLHSMVDSKGMPTSYRLYKSARRKPGDGPLTVACPSPVLRLACGDYAVNTMEPDSQPAGRHYEVLPLQEAPTIGDELSAAGIDWAWYSGGWSNAAGQVGGPGWTNGTGPRCSVRASKNTHFPYCPNKLFQFHHQPFDYYENYAEGAPGRVHLRDEEEFIQLAQSSKTSCKLKPVSFVKPLGQENEHPGYASEHFGSDQS